MTGSSRMDWRTIILTITLPMDFSHFAVSVAGIDLLFFAVTLPLQVTTAMAFLLALLEVPRLLHSQGEASYTVTTKVKQGMKVIQFRQLVSFARHLQPNKFGQHC